MSVHVVGNFKVSEKKPSLINLNRKIWKETYLNYNVWVQCSSCNHW